MFRSVRVLVSSSVQSSARCYVTHREFKKTRSVWNQDEEKVPKFHFPPSHRINRRVYVWGLSVTGALGVHQNLKKLKSRNAHVVHHPTRQPFAERHHVIDVAAGYGFTLFACKPDENGITLFGTGLNTDSQIGFHKLGGSLHKPMSTLIYPAPIQLPRPSIAGELVEVQSIAAGRSHSAVLANNGCVYTFGNNSFGQCGRAIIAGENFSESQVMHRMGAETFGKGDKLTKVICGQDHTLFLTEKGCVFACGWGADGQTGLGHYNCTETPERVGGDISKEKIVKIASSVDCVLALNDRGELFGWGNSEYGQLASDTDAQQINTPKYVQMAKACGKIVDIAAGGSFCLALNDSGDVFVWGFGLLGLGPKADYASAPTLIPHALFGRNEFNPDSKVSSIFSGVNHMAAITDKHDLFIWGKNQFGCLGLGHENDQLFPYKVSIGAHPLKIACGFDHSVAFCKPII